MDLAAPAARPSGRDYVQPERLAALLVEYQARLRDGIKPPCTDEFAAVLLMIVRGTMRKYQFTLPEEDFEQAALCHLLGSPLRSCDPARNPFSYLTTCVMRFGRKAVAKDARHLAGEARYRRDRAHVARQHGHHLTETSCDDPWE